MVQTDSQPGAVGGRENTEPARQFYLILYPKELEDEVIQSLESTGVPGYTEMPKMVGRGRHVRHFDNAVWPGATGAVFTVVTPEEARPQLLPHVRSAGRESGDAQPRPVRHPHLRPALRADHLIAE